MNTDSDDAEAGAVQHAANHIQAAIHALELATNTSTSAGRRRVYASWLLHLQDDWRGVALLAARREA